MTLSHPSALTFIYHWSPAKMSQTPHNQLKSREADGCPQPAVHSSSQYPKSKLIEEKSISPQTQRIISCWFDWIMLMWKLKVFWNIDWNKRRNVTCILFMCILSIWSGNKEIGLRREVGEKRMPFTVSLLIFNCGRLEIYSNKLGGRWVVKNHCRLSTKRKNWRPPILGNRSHGLCRRKRKSTSKVHTPSKRNTMKTGAPTSPKRLDPPTRTSCSSRTEWDTFQTKTPRTDMSWYLLLHSGQFPSLRHQSRRRNR